MKSKKQQVQVRVKQKFGNPGDVLETIKVMLKAEQIGNFNPIFCAYQGKKHLVSSMEGDLSDPFRREECYLETLYIEV